MSGQGLSYRQPVRSRLRVLLLLPALVGLGCGGPEGPERAHVSGTVLYQGEPLPAGDIRFLPYVERGGSGPQTVLEIWEGKYDSDKTGKGPTPGPQIVTVYGYDGKPTPMFPKGADLFAGYTEHVVVPSGYSTHDFDVPKGGRPERRGRTGR